MSTNGKLRVSPVASIEFMAAANPVKQSKSDDKEVYTIKLAFDVKKDKEFLDFVSEINDAKVVTERTYRGKSDSIKELLSAGKALVGANSQFKPTIYDSKGNELEEAPLFFPESTGTAQMIIQPYEGKRGGTINLIGIIIHSVETPEGVEGSGKGKEAILADLRAIVAQATK